MAVPCMVTSGAHNEENWRRLERLLCELFLVLRALMVHPTTPPTTPSSRQPPSGGPPPPQPPAGGGSGSGGGAVPSSSVTIPIVQSRACTASTSRGRARRRTPLSEPKLPSNAQSSMDSWQQLGSELRDIADTLSPAKRAQPKLIQIRRVPAIYEVPGEVTKLTSCLTLGVTALSLLRTAWGDAD